MVAHVFTVAPTGYEGVAIEVECDIKKGLPAVQIVGMSTKSVDEAKDRVRSAISNSLLDFPPRKVTINLAPAEIVKEGAHYDLPIAVAILIASGQLRQHEADRVVYAGELALDGSLRPIRGTINIIQTAKEAGIKRVYIPRDNVNQARLIDGIEIIGVNNLKELYLHLKGESKIAAEEDAPIVTGIAAPQSTITLDDVIGQEQAKRALTIAVAGHHNVLLTGPPGAGKTMLARALNNLMPALTPAEMIAVTKIHSMAGEVDGEIVSERPFRTPHHTTSQVAVIGGGAKPKPGEVSLAHMGVLFLDEIPEYTRSVLEALRQPLEDKKISVSRAAGKVTYPADFMLVATMNPCPCGHLGDPVKECVCTSTQILAYQKKLSGPLLDRIDLVISVSRVPNDALLTKNTHTNKQHAYAFELIQNALFVQNNRYKSGDIYNGSLNSSSVSKYMQMDSDARQILAMASDRLGLSARSHFKVIKVAQTIADMDGAQKIESKHISEALQYRG